MRLIELYRIVLFAVIFGAINLFESQAAVVIFDNIPQAGQTGYDSSYYSHGFESQNTAELGNVVNLAGTARKLDTVTITMVTSAKAEDYAALYAANNSGWNHSLMVTIWKADASEVLTTKTITSLIPWATPSGNNTAMAFNVAFDFSSENITLPNSVLVSVAYNTEHCGYAPLGVIGPYNSLNYGTFDYAPFVGTDATPGEVMRVLSSDTNAIVFETAPGWTNRTPMMEITATETSTPPYDAWIASYGYTVGSGPALRLSDPDGDGINNLTEFAFGLDPTAKSLSPITIARSNTTITLTWLQRNDNSATYTNRSTTNLMTGFPSGNSTNFVASTSTNTNNLPGLAYTRYQFSTNTASFLRSFYKVDAEVR